MYGTSKRENREMAGRPGLRSAIPVAYSARPVSGRARPAAAHRDHALIGVVVTADRAGRDVQDVQHLSGRAVLDIGHAQCQFGELAGGAAVYTIPGAAISCCRGSQTFTECVAVQVCETERRCRWSR